MVLLMGCDNSWLVIEELFREANENTNVVFFYFDFVARSEQSPANMLGSLLRQLVGGLGKIPELVVQTFRKHGRGAGGKGLPIPEILNLFKAITATKRTFICVDALDECAPEHRMAVLGSLRQILQESPNTSLFMTGRPYVRSEVERGLDGGATFMLIQPTEDGILGYLRDKLQNDPNPEIMNSTLEAEIMKTVPKITSGMYVETSARERPKPMADIFESRFRLASLYIKAILQGITLADRKKALESAGGGAALRKAYDGTLERIKAQGKERTKLAMATLTWVCHFERPLQIDELCHALAVQREATDFDPDRIPSIGILLHCCQGLITVDEKTSAVCLIHDTVKNYLCSLPALFSTPHSILAEICLAYLSSRYVSDLTSRSLPDHQRTPFLQYSSRYWGEHAGRGRLSGHARTLALKLLDHYEDHVSAGSLLRQVVHPNCIGDIGASPRFSGLHVASFFGIAELVDVILKAGGCGVNGRDCTDSTPLVWAARNGHAEAAELLLRHKDVQPDYPDIYGRTPLGAAAANGHEGMVGLLLDRGVDPNLSDKHDETPLGWAAINGYEGVVRLLLGRKDIDPNLPDANGRTPLGCAAVEGHEGVVGLLLGHGGARPDRPDNSGQTPLWFAAFRGHEGIVKLLLERKDVVPDRPDRNSQTPLRCAEIEGHEGVVKLLLKRKT